MGNLRGFVVGVVLGLSACGTPKPPAAPAWANMGLGADGRCRGAATNAAPIVTEWSASEKANLESLLGGGGIAVEYTGCAMRVLPQCQLRGSYTWQRTTPSSDVLEIRNQDDLYAKLPLGAVSLEGELQRSGSLAVTTRVTGQLRLKDASVADVPIADACAAATHVVGALSVGAFALTAGASYDAKGSGNIAGVGSMGGSTASSARLVRSAGAEAECANATEMAPSADCRSPLQVFLLPIPGRAVEEGPPGTVRVDFQAAAANKRWDVYIDDAVVCTTPCTKWMDPARPVFMRTREEGGMFGFGGGSDKVKVNRVGNGSANAWKISAHGTSSGKLLTGITFAALGGTAMLAGGMLAGIGCSRDDEDGKCNGGLWALGIGAVIGGGATWLIFDSFPSVEVRPSEHLQLRPSARAERPRVVISPLGVAGTF